MHSLRKWCVIAGSSGTHLVCVCTSHQNTILLVDALNWEVTYKAFVNKVVCDPSNWEGMMDHYPNCSRTNPYHKICTKTIQNGYKNYTKH